MAAAKQTPGLTPDDRSPPPAFNPFVRRRNLAYAAAVLVPTALVAIRLAFGYQPGDPPRIFVFMIPIILCGYAGGLGPGLVATLSSAVVSDYFLLRAPGGAPLAGMKVIQWQLLLLHGSFISVLMEALLRARRKHHAILSSSLDAIIVMDHRGRIAEFNPGAERIFGRAARDVVGRELAEVVIPPALRDQHRAGMARYLASGNPRVLGRRLEMPAIRADGTEFPVELSIQRVENSSPPTFTGFIRDVSDRHAAEEALRANELRFRNLIENSSDLISVISESGVIRYQSPSTPRLIGRTAEEMTNRPLTEFIHEADHGRIGRALRGILEGRDQAEPLEFRLQHRDGTWRTFQAFGKPAGGTGSERQVVLNSRDVTQSRALEEQLRQAQKMEAIGQLAAGVAHDFNNLLTVIKGHLGLLTLSGRASPETARSYKSMTEAADRAAGLTRQLLTFSRQQAMEQKDHDLNVLVTECGGMLRRLVTEEIDVVTACAPEPLPIRADAGMVEQVLMNLVVNARDAMPRGGTLRVKTERVSVRAGDTRIARGGRPGDFSCVEVSDTGMGIAPEILPRIFEPFFTTKAVGHGTGLGLATIYGIMQQHGGWITVDSALGRGATFRVHFPAKGTGRTQREGASDDPLQRGTGTILLVEDEPAVRLLGETALTGLGYRVLTAETAVGGLAVWRERQAEIDLVITDLVVPGGMNGRELAELVGVDRPEMRVVFTSGYSHTVAGPQLALREGDNFLQKPFDVARLAQIVRTNLGKSSRPPT